MSRHINVNPGHYKVRGRERQGEEILHVQQKQAFAAQGANARWEARQHPQPSPHPPEQIAAEAQLPTDGQERNEPTTAAGPTRVVAAAAPASGAKMAEAKAKRRKAGTSRARKTMTKTRRPPTKVKATSRSSSSRRRTAAARPRATRRRARAGSKKGARSR